jgi:hypothetical protein
MTWFLIGKRMRKRRREEEEEGIPFSYTHSIQERLISFRKEKGR